jgi:hypothetical protein
MRQNQQSPPTLHTVLLYDGWVTLQEIVEPTLAAPFRR